MKKQLFVLIALFLGTLAQARIAVISDIDDTIKVAHVLDRSDSVKKAFKTQNLFRGMNILYQEIALSNPGTKFYYISNAIRTIMSRSHRQFLTQHKFPNGTLALRESLGETNHKVETIRKILKDPEINFVIFIGDNGERDTEVYAQMRKEFPTIPTMTFIRQAYSTSHNHNEDIGKPLKPAQNGFMTPIEISIDLSQIGILTSSQLNRIESAYIPPTLGLAVSEDRSGNDGVLSFPRWIDCRDFVIPESLKKQSTLTGVLVRRLVQRCSIPAIED